MYLHKVCLRFKDIIICSKQ